MNVLLEIVGTIDDFLNELFESGPLGMMLVILPMALIVSAVVVGVASLAGLLI